MTTIRKMSFVLLSVSAFIYLVTQSSSGQQWMGDIAKLFTADTQEVQQQGAQQQAQQEEQATKQQDSSKQYERIEQLESQVASLHDLTQTMRNNLRQLQDEFDVLATKQTDLVLPTTKASEQADATVSEASMSSSPPVKDLFNIPAQQDGRQRQLAHQARLQDVVQRMELTALKALTR